MPITVGQCLLRRSRFACHRFDPSSEGGEGSPYTEKYEASFNWSQQVMDPGTTYWQDTISAAVRDAHKAGNTSGVYVDQIASMYASSCYGHGHSGGGSRWADGNRATLEKAAKSIGPGKVLISESNAEAYLSSLHAYLAIYGWRECGVVPAFQAVCECILAALVILGDFFAEFGRAFFPVQTVAGV